MTLLFIFSELIHIAQHRNFAIPFALHQHGSNNNRTLEGVGQEGVNAEENQQVVGENSFLLMDTGGHYVFGTPNRCLDAAILVLVEAVGDKYEYIDWWLYELGDKVIELADGSQTWDLTTPEALYDYIVNVCN